MNTRSDNPPPAAASSPLEEVLSQCIEALESGGPEAVEAILSQHPRLAGPARRLLGVLGDLDLVDEARRATVPVGPIADFRPLRRIGEGGMGVVYLARQQSVDRLVALKVLRESMGDLRRAERFRREARAMARLRHRHIVTVHAAGEDDGTLYIAMELLSGSSLEDVLRQARRDDRLVPVRDVARWGAEIARALAAAHDAGLVHRDVKPSNVWVREDGDAVLLDFGLARDAAAATITLSGGFQGSAHYASPEQVEGRARAIDARTDVFSLGVTLYVAVTGIRPFEGETTEQVFHQILVHDPPPPSRLNPGVPRDFETIVSKAMEKEPGRRYASAEALGRDLEAFMEGRPIGARPPGRVARVTKWARRRPAAAIALASLIALAGTLAIGMTSTLTLLDETRRVSDEKDEALRRAHEERASRELTLAALRLRDLFREEEELWPARPDRVAGPGGMDAWLRDARRLQDDLPQLRKKLTEIEARGQIPPEARAGRKKILRAIAKLEEVREQAGPAVSATKRARSDWRDYRIERRRRQLARLAPLRFADADAGERYAALCELTDGIPRLEPLVARVAARRGLALSLERRTVDDRRAAWDEATAVARADERLGGLELVPQRGLVPLGPDPVTGLLEFAHFITGTIPRRDASGRLGIGEDTALVLVLLPGGTFRMGAVAPPDGHAESGGPNVDPGAQAGSEDPVHEVTLEPFFISKYEMTQGQWQRVTGENPSRNRAGLQTGGSLITPEHPVESVSWWESVLWLARMELTLPSEAQWEYAARAGTTTRWWTGDAIASLRGAGNVADATAAATRAGAGWTCDDSLEDGHVIHAPVGRFRANPFGLHDVIGNVYEWCFDFYSSYEAGTTKGNGRRRGIAAPFRVARSGPYSSPPAYQRSATRARFAPELSYDGLGVRPARRLTRE